MSSSRPILTGALRRKAQRALRQVKRSRQTRVEAAERVQLESDSEDANAEEDLLTARETEQVQVDFKFCDSRGEADEFSVRSLMQTGWTSKVLGFDDTAVRALAAECTAQVEIGTFVKTEDDDENVLAFATVLDTWKTLPQVLRRRLSELGLEGKKVGWIVREALVNVPPQVTFQLLSCLKDDLEWAKQEKFASFDYMLLLAPCYDTPASASGTMSVDDGASKKKKKKQKTSKRTDAEYAMSEDYVLANAATESAFFRLSRPPPKEGVDEPESLEHAPWACNALIFPTQAFYFAVDSLSRV